MRFNEVWLARCLVWLARRLVYRSLLRPSRPLILILGLKAPPGFVLLTPCPLRRISLLRRIYRVFYCVLFRIVLVARTLARFSRLGIVHRGRTLARSSRLGYESIESIISTLQSGRIIGQLIPVFIVSIIYHCPPEIL
jgi:hypothetical protein